MHMESLPASLTVTWNESVVPIAATAGSAVGEVPAPFTVTVPCWGLWVTE